jgi:hypothetical protein
LRLPCNRVLASLCECHESHDVNTAADLARLRAKGKTLTASEFKELNTRIKALEEMDRIEVRLRLLFPSSSPSRPRIAFFLYKNTTQVDSLTAPVINNYMSGFFKSSGSISFLVLPTWEGKPC